VNNCREAPRGGGHVPKHTGALSKRGTRLITLVFLTLVSFLAGLHTASARLPVGWSDTDIGAPADAGSASYSNGTWTVSGGGADIWGTNDQCNFASQVFNCDGSIVALVTSVQNTDPTTGWSKAGVMFRNDTTAGAVNVFMTATAGQGVAFQIRYTAGASSFDTVIGGIPFPVWVKVIRSSDLFSGYYSLDGTNWTQVGSTVTVEMAGPALAGLAVCAHNDAALNTSTFTNVGFSPTTFGVYRELWTNLNTSVGDNLAALTNTAYNPDWPNDPVASFTHIFTNFETEINTGMNYYGQRLRTFVVPPTNGQYAFWIASDDTSQLFLSANENPADMVLIAQNASWTPSEDWTEYPDQQSALISLQGGCRYYLEALMQQGNGGDNLSVRWQLPNGAFEQPMAAVSTAGTYLIPYDGVSTMPGIFSQSSSQAVVENLSAFFSVLVTNQASVNYQWFNGAGEIAGANLAVYTLSNVSLAINNGQIFTCVVSNSVGSVTSAPITLTVLRDTVPPTVAGVFNLGPSNVEIVFSKPVAVTNATNVANYAFTNGVAIAGASLSADELTVTLTNAPLVNGSNYAIVINNIYDLASIPISIATNSQVSFTASPFAPQDIGSPAIASTATYTTNVETVSSAGYDIGGTSDQCNFEYQLKTANFDVTVCLAALGLSDLWAEAGLMARASLFAGSPFAAALATPVMNGDFFADRTATDGLAVTSGSFPVNYPNTWLRLKRVGNVFTGFGSYDGTNWTQLGSATIAMPAQIYLGLTVASHSTNESTTAEFVDYETTPIGAVAATTVNAHEPLGPSSRKTGIVISEIMWKPAPRTDGNNVEFLEIYNTCPFFQDISSYMVTCADMNYKFPANTLIPGGAFFVLAASPPGIANVYGLTSNVFGPYTGSLKHAETLEVLDEHSNVLLTVPYTDVYPWPVAASGTGHSIVLANPTYGEGNPRAWDISDTVGGSPGQIDPFTPSPLRSVVINEILPHTENPAVPQFIELYNHSTASVDVSGCILTDDPATNEFVIPTGTVIGPGGFVAFEQSQFGFILNGQGETLYFIKPDGSRVLDAVQFGAQADGVSYGRWPDGANDFYAFTTNTPGAHNSTVLIGDVVINELMYDPISGNDDDQYIELYNKGTNTINLSGWQFTAGVTFTFPPGAVVGPNGYAVVGKNTANLLANYTNLNSGNTFGNYGGKLSHDGELVALCQPESYFGTNTIYVEEDEVTYGTGGRWGEWSSGGGSSLELIDPHSNHRLAANWADSDETQKSSWVLIENTGVLDNGSNYDPSIDYAQIGLLDQGECLVDNIEVVFDGTNYVSNGTFEGGLGLTDWSLQGCMARSSLENSGYESSYSLHIRCSDKIWTGDNSCEVALNGGSTETNANPMASGDTVTLRYEARWLHGWPEPLLRLNGNWLEATAAMPVPSNLGSPGGPNSQYITNAGPAMYNVTHTPTLPAAGQEVVVTAQAHDPDGIKSLTLYYRVDPATSYSSVPMNDKGTGGDAIAGDGIYSATISGQASNQIVAFYISAVDNLGAATRFPALRTNDNVPVPECVIMFGDGIPGGSFGAYHLWITQTNATRWANLGNLSNEGNDCTFVNDTRVIYNMQGRFAGSPYHQQFDTPAGSLCHYKWTFNDDDKFLGATDFNKIHQPGNGPGDDASLQREELANTFLRALGAPWLYKRLVAVYVNGNRRGGTLMEDTQVPGSDIVKEYFPNDTDGFLYKMQPWFEMAPFLSGYDMSFDNQSWCNLMPYTTTGGVKKVARYRYNFEIRRTPDSDNDYTNVFSLVDAANSYGTPNYVAKMENMANMEEWTRVFAANHAAGNWDSFGAQNAQNLYGYIGTLGTKYALLMWDFNIVIGNSGSWGPGQDLFTVNGEDPNTQNIYNNPTFLRMYWRALQELVNGPLDVANSGPLLMAKFNAFTENGLTVENPTDNIEPWLSQAQSSIASQLAAVNATNFSVNRSFVVSNNVAYVSGGAPVNVDFVWINGVAYPLIWTGLTNWTVTVPLTNGANVLNIVAVDDTGQPIAGTSNELTVNYGGTVPSPVGHVAINEIMWNPAVPDAQYVELVNNSTNITYDLSGWQLQGLTYTFPSGSLLAPQSFLVLAANAPAFAAAYGATNLVFDTFSSTLTPGQTLSLLQPSGASNLIVAQVQFDDVLPWPTNANNPGVSLQLIDSQQDNWRVGNWSTGQTNVPPVVPQWVESSATGTASSSTIYIYLQSAGDVYVDDIEIVAGSVPGVGANVLPDGNFKSGFPGPWVVSPNLTGSALSSSVQYDGADSLHVVSTSAGTTRSSAIYQDISPTLASGQPYTISYWYLQSTNGGPLTIRLSGSGIVDTVDPAPPTVLAPLVLTPDASNSVAATLPAFPPLWINEVEADNLTGLTNSAGEHAPWLELYNPGTNIVALAGLYLTSDYANLTNWAFPSGATINPGQFLVVFTDNQTNLSTLSQLHTSFALGGSNGSVALSRVFNGQPQVLDYVNFTNLPPNWSYGSLPDGQSFVRVAFYSPSPGASNSNTGPPPSSFIAYNSEGSIYAQSFDSLPDPGATSVNTANPVTIDGITYSLANPFDFAFPVSATGSSGGLGLSGMSGWFGLADPTASVGTRFGATDGDQTTGGQISFGLPDSSNRALGLLATSTTGYTAMGAKFINNTGVTMHYMNLQVTGEVWRQSNVPKTLEFYYLIDPTATAPMSTNATAYVPAMNVSFPTVAGDAGGVAVDGTAPADQINLAVTNQPIVSWPPGEALWLVWEMADATGKAQGLAIDNLSFVATALGTPTNSVALSFQNSLSNPLVLSWPAPATGYQLYSATNLAPPVVWSLVTSPAVQSGGTFYLTIPATNATAQFFRLMAR
jgi:hypothetical protein